MDALVSFFVEKEMDIQIDTMFEFFADRGV